MSSMADANDCRRRANICKLIIAVYVSLLVLATLSLCYSTILARTIALLSVPIFWPVGSESFLIKQAPHQNLDTSFPGHNYSDFGDASSPYPIPPVLHFIHLNAEDTEPTQSSRQDPDAPWKRAMQTCIDMHPGWEWKLWDDDAAQLLLSEHSPLHKEMWLNYPHAEQRRLLLQYALLAYHGGVVLDAGLECQQHLGPLRQFEFVGLGKRVSGLSSVFMMSAKRSDLVEDLVDVSPNYNLAWWGSREATISFSIGDALLSLMHTKQSDRAQFKVLADAAFQCGDSTAGPPLFTRLNSERQLSAEDRLFERVFQMLQFGIIISHQLTHLSATCKITLCLLLMVLGVLRMRCSPRRSWQPLLPVQVDQK